MLVDKMVNLISIKYRNNKVPFLSSIIVGLIAHAFSFFSKLVQQDDVTAFFGKGSSLSSGRWMLELTSAVMPDYSMPWIYGILSIFMLAVASVVLINLFSIKNKLSQAIISSMFAAFPAITGLFTIPFVAAPNCLAILLAVFSARVFTHGNKASDYILGVCFLVISLGIYQAYITLTSSIMIVYMLTLIYKEDMSIKRVLLKGINYVVLLIISLACYGVITICVNKICGVELLGYAYSDYSILKRIRVAYTSFLGIFIKGYFSYVNSVVSLAAHAVCVVLAAITVFVWFKNNSDRKKLFFSIFLLLLLPLSTNAMHLASSPDVLGTIVFESFITIYFIIIIIDEQIETSGLSVKICNLFHSVTMLGLCAIIFSNIYFSNEVYLKMYMQTEHMESFYTSVMTQIMMNDDYDGTQTIALIGNPDDITYSIDEIDTDNFVGFCTQNIYDMYTREEFIKLYLGYDLSFANDNEIGYIKSTDEYSSMTVYPAKGAINLIDNYIVVRFE